MSDPSLSVYEQLLSDSKLLPLSTFRNRRVKKIDFFPHANQLPTFFSYNLLSDGRVIKLLRGTEAVWRGFYYQLMKLGFQIQNPKEDYSSAIKAVAFQDCSSESTINSSPISGRQYSHRQYLRIVAEFMEILDNEVIPNFQMTLSQYPIFDEAMLYCLENILEKQIMHNKNVVSILEVLQILCEVFSIHLEVYDSCVKFVESDVFIYFHDQFEVYVAFLNQMAEIEQNEKSEENLSSNDQEKEEKNSRRDHLQFTEEMQAQKKMRLSTGINSRKRIQNIPAARPSKDSVNSVTPSITRNVFQMQSDVLKQSETNHPKNEKNFLEDIKSISAQSKNGKFSSQKSLKNQQKISQKYSSLSSFQQFNDDKNIEFQKSNTPGLLSNFSKQKNNQFEKSDIFHHPSSKFSSSNLGQKIINLNAEKLKHKEKNETLQQANSTLGTFYRQFTNTKIMQAMTEPFKTHVRRTRDRFRGIRSKNFFGFS